MRTILFTNVRDEPHIVEWVEHHLALGFDTIFIFDHRSRVSVKSKVRHLPNVIVEFLNTEFANKMGLMLAAASYASRKGFDWMMYLDGDEFLFLRQDDSVKDTIDRYPREVSQIGFNWLIFGSNGLDERPRDILPAYLKSNRNFNGEVKVLVRPHAVNLKITPSPHFFVLKKGSGASVGWDGGALTGPLYKDKTGMDPSQAFAYVAHYIVQSYQTYLLRKRFRDRDDIPGAKWPVIEKDTFHSRYNDVENRDVFDRYRGRYTEREVAASVAPSVAASVAEEKMDEWKEEEKVVQPAVVAPPAVSFKNMRINYHRQLKTRF